MTAPQPWTPPSDVQLGQVAIQITHDTPLAVPPDAAPLTNPEE